MNVNNLVSLLSLLYGYYYQPEKGTGKQEVKHHPWSYEGNTGPAHWGEKYPKCNGNRQSPINIMTSDVTPVTWLSPFEFVGFDQISGHQSQTFLRLRNNGHTASMAVEDEMYIQGANLGDRYRTAEIHFHWGQDNALGSEHGINNHHHPLEIHFVHYNIRYGNLSEAMQHPDGLTVIGVFADISQEHNAAFEHISESLDKVKEYNSKTTVTGIRPMDLLPRNTNNFFHYEGSLTTPPCYESVLWFVMEDKIKVSDGQIRRLRHLKEHVDEKHTPHPPSGKNDTATISEPVSSHNNVNYITANYRPVQNINGRTVYCSNPSMKIVTRESRIRNKKLQKADTTIANRVSQGGSVRMKNEIPLDNRVGSVRQSTSRISTAQDTHGSNNLIPSQNSQNALTDNMNNGKGNTLFDKSALSQATNIGTPAKVKINFDGQAATEIQDRAKSGSTMQDFGFNGAADLGNEAIYSNPEAETNQEEIWEQQNEEAILPSKSYGEYRTNQRHYDAGSYFDSASYSNTKSATYGGSTKSSKQSGFSTTNSKQKNNGSNFGSGDNPAVNSLIETTKTLAAAPGSAKTGGVDNMKKAKLLKAFANIFLKQADILQRMQLQKQRQFTPTNPTFLLSSVNNNAGVLPTKEFSNPSTGFVSRGDLGISGFGQQRVFNNHRIEFPQTNAGEIGRSQMAAYNAAPVSIETPSWNSPSLTKFSQAPKDFIQRQHLTYYDPLDRPDQQYVLSAPSPKYNIIEPPPQWPLNIVPSTKSILQPTPKLEAFRTQPPKKKRAPRRKRKDAKSTSKSKRKRRWLIDLLSDYAQLMKKLKI